MNECKCVCCGECHGNGTVRIGLGGQIEPCDDMYELESCLDCHGSGVSEVCENCMDAEEDDLP